jgi:hypothetical protein
MLFVLKENSESQSDQIEAFEIDKKLDRAMSVNISGGPTWRQLIFGYKPTESKS